MYIQYTQLIINMKLKIKITNRSMLSEAVKKAAPRRAERDISRAVMNQLNKYRNSSHFAEWLSHADKKPGSRPEGYQAFAYGLGKKIDVPASAAGGTEAQDWAGMYAKLAFTLNNAITTTLSTFQTHRYVVQNVQAICRKTWIQN